MSRPALRYFTCFAFLFFTQPGFASPADLSQWRDWVLEKHIDRECPWVLGSASSRECIWPGRLEIELRGKGLSFNYQVEVFQDDALVPLPGAPGSWPMNVMVNATRAAVLDRKGVPHASLNKGKHIIQGQIQWQRRPSGLAVPESIALVTLTDQGRSASPERRDGQIVLGRDTEAAPVKLRNALGIEVFRKLTDGVPMTLETRAVLTVSGEPREVEVGQLAWPNTALMAIESPLPARIEENGNLRVQLSAGRHSVVVMSRLLKSPEQFAPQRHGEPWPEFEYLSFAGNSDLRQVKFSGAPGIDTSQVPIPAQWKELPAWRLDGSTTLQMVTEYRGDQSPAANTITVNRNLWLDFDGTTLTGVESVTGSMRRDWRLNAQPDTRLGSAQVSGHPVLVTTHGEADGVEIRSPEIALQAVTRIGSPTRFSATGWDIRADGFSATLHIPPGWRVMHATGVDGIYGTWLSNWDLWGIFLVLIIVAATRRLVSFPAACLALAALLAGYHEPGMPTGLLAVVLLLLPISVIAAGRIKRSIDVALVLSCAGLTLALVAFSINNFRLAIYPSLERGSVGVYQSSVASTDSAVSMLTNDLTESRQELRAPVAEAVRSKLESSAGAAAPTRGRQDAYMLGENDRVQTGPGAPNWLWNTVQLKSTSPVPESSELSLWYSSPWMTRLWRVFAALLTVAYGGLLMYSALRGLRSNGAVADSAGDAPAVTQASVVLALIAGLSFGGLSQTVDAGEYPPSHLLDELERRLIKSPACAPDCVSLEKGVIQTTRDTLSIGFSAYADTDVLLLLPTPRQGWQVSDVLIDGNNNTASRRHQGHLAVLLPQGHHVISVSGKLSGDIASVSLPTPIHNLSASGQHWQLSGLVDGRVPSGTLSLRAAAAVREKKRDTLTPEPITPFFAVHREFYLGTQWRVTTRVTRLAPMSGPVSVDVALLAFERPLSASVNFKDGHARLQFNDRQRDIAWESSMQPVDSLQLVAANGTHYVETWRLLPSALWRVDHEGVPPTRAPSGVGSMQPHWKPWPGESLRLQFARPPGIAGPTFTVEQASLVHRAGGAVQQNTLTLKIKASIGQDYVLELPADARVTALSRNNTGLNLPEASRVSVALQPGEQHIEVEFEQEGGSGWLSTTPKVTLPDGASNITLTYTLPQDRWPLYLTGPDIGPAMLYWGVFCVIILGAVLLTVLSRRLPVSIPIGLPGWLLLGIGLSTVNSYGVIIVAVFFFLAAFRQRLDPASISRINFNLLQTGLGIWALITLVTLVSAIPMGLLSSPDMLVSGNNSWSHLYNFFQDRAGQNDFPTATVISVNLAVYRLVMLVWSLWLASRLIRWVAWAWKAYAKEGLWLPKLKAPDQ
ncbi:hypothetical protein [Pseudohalioglobus lutimaris]|uniref:Uncharacterized protein n=1 Tax=Pseudohalioglobus lutimaris TaxID=1737061 RepID=A0A2N5X7Z2_9GAMM|nr:hypothetical protein [Pseudohalioglobus lutimaris]PLW70604.1 hypothetical protein C0039_00270 [Pseudohalioglobus lutimaris]